MLSRKKRIAVATAAATLVAVAALAYLSSTVLLEGSVQNKVSSEQPSAVHYGISINAGNGELYPCHLKGESGEGEECVLTHTLISDHELTIENTGARPIEVPAKAKLLTSFTDNKEGEGCSPSWFVASPGNTGEGPDTQVTAMLNGTHGAFTIPRGKSHLEEDWGGTAGEQVRVHEAYSESEAQNACIGAAVELHLKLEGVQ
jgi:hypothetical protein